MEIYLKEKINLSNIKKYLKEYGMEDLGLDIDIVTEDKFVKIFIKKIATSSIVLEERIDNDSYVYRVVSENIALLHKPFRKLIDSNLTNAIERLGGKLCL